MSWPGLLTSRRAALLFGLGNVLGLALGWQPMVLGFGTDEAKHAAPDVSVVGMNTLASGDVLRAAAVSAQSSFAALDASHVADRVERHPWIDAASAVALPPRRLLVRVVEREPVGHVAIGTDRWWVDARGLAFAPFNADAHRDVPEFVGISDVSPGSGHRLLHLAVSVGHAVAKIDGVPALRSVRVGGTSPDRLPEITLAGDIRVVIGPGELREKLSRLEQLFAEILDTKLSGSEIDLRFGNRMVLRGEAVRSAALTSLRRTEVVSGTGGVGH